MSAFVSIDQILKGKDVVCDFTEINQSTDTFMRAKIINKSRESCASNLTVEQPPFCKILKKEQKKTLPSYTAIIAEAILSSKEQKLPLCALYEYIREHYPGIMKKGQGWRNCVRHNLSLSDCFMKAGKARNGRGNNWGIHPEYKDNFLNGDYRKRHLSKSKNRRKLDAKRLENNIYTRVSQEFLTNKKVDLNFSIENILSNKRKRPEISDMRFHSSVSLQHSIAIAQNLKFEPIYYTGDCKSKTLLWHCSKEIASEKFIREVTGISFSSATP